MRPEDAVADWGILEEMGHKMLDNWHAKVVREILRQGKISASGETRLMSHDLLQHLGLGWVGLGLQMFHNMRYIAEQKYDIDGHPAGPSGLLFVNSPKTIFLVWSNIQKSCPRLKGPSKNSTTSCKTRLRVTLGRVAQGLVYLSLIGPKAIDIDR